MITVAIVDVGIGNLRSVEKAIARSAADAGTPCAVTITADADAVSRADKVVLPGQGAFRDCSRALANGMGDAVRAQIRKGTPYLGICLGLQVLLEASDEAPGLAGLGVFPGTNVRMKDGERDPATGAPVKVPHMGWNRIALRSGGHPYLSAAGGEGTYFYFVHSFHAAPVDRAIVVATAQHGPFEVTAAIAKDNVFATQFHPEKSQDAGLALLAAFVRG